MHKVSSPVSHPTPSVLVFCSVSKCRVLSPSSASIGRLLRTSGWFDDHFRSLSPPSASKSFITHKSSLHEAMPFKWSRGDVGFGSKGNVFSGSGYCPASSFACRRQFLALHYWVSGSGFC